MLIRRKKLRLWLAAFTTVLLLAACGDTGSNGGSVPNAGEDPSSPTNQDPINTGGGSTSGIPDLSGAVVLSLFDKINYSGLAELAGNIFLPVVGDTKIKLQVTNTRAQAIEGKVLIAFEDKKGFWGAEIPSVKGTGINTSGYFDIIFSDDALTVRATGSRTGDTISGTAYYRNRASGETACKTIDYVCKDQYGNTYPLDRCGIYSIPDVVGPCRTYMTPGGSVKGLGTFTVNFTDIAVLN